MTWRPSSLTRNQMEERRLAGGRLLKAGVWSQAKIAEHVGVSRATVCDWAKTLKTGGMRRLRRRPTPGRPCKLTDYQRRELIRCLKRGACSAGFPSDRWTSTRVRILIKQLFDKEYHPNYINRFLRKLSWKPRKSLPCI